MASCANCSKEFTKRPGGKGYYRFSLENSLHFGNLSGRDLLADVTGTQFTPVSNKRKGQFVCPECWTKLNDTSRYQHSLEEFWGRTGTDSYISQKKRSSFGSPRSSPTKKARFTSTPCQKKGAAKTLFSKKASKSSKWDSIISAVRARQYGRAIRGLFSATKSSKTQFIRFVVSVVRKEIVSLLQQKQFPLFQDVNVVNIEQFSWIKTLNEFQQTCPMVFNVMRGAITNKANEDSLVRGKSVNLKPQIGTTIACMLHAKAPNTASFIPSLFSVQFWRGGLKRNVMKQLAHTGICKGYDTTLGTLDKIRKGFDSAATTCKIMLERQNATLGHEAINMEADTPVLVAAIPNIEEEVNERSSSSQDTVLLNMDDTIPYMEDDTDEDEDLNNSNDLITEEVLFSSDEDNDFEKNIVEQEAEVSEERKAEGVEEQLEGVEDEGETVPIEEQQLAVTSHPGFSMCWDNVGKKVTSRHPTENSKNTYLNMALGYLAVNRVPTTQSSWKFNDDLQKASNLSSNIFVPNEKDFEMLSNRMNVIVARIITRYLPWFNSYFSDCVTSHILHEYSAESSTRSVLINLGVFDVDPSSTQGAIEIYESLQKYIPSIQEKPYTSIVFGDGLSCERGNDAHRARANGLNAWERLEGCEPAVQEFHKEMILLQDYFDEFFKGSSAADRGTLFHLKNIFNFRRVKSDISDNFNHAWELMCTVTEGYVSLLAMELLGMTKRSDRPKSAPDSIENSSVDNRATFLQSVVRDIVAKVWHKLHTESLKTDDQTEPEVYCCGENVEDDVILCGAGRNCPRGEVFHYSCVGLDSDDLPNNWFCSDSCRNAQDEYPYCTCHVDLGDDEPMIGCSAGSKCTAEEWYHTKCIAMTDIPEGTWYCKKACKTSKKAMKKKRSPKTSSNKTDDLVFQHSRGITWVGLNLLCRRDAVREADGEAMMSYWKSDLVHFFASKHPKYVILAHRLLVSINGWLPDKLKNDLIYNRTVNYGGGIGRNLPMDFMNEILNRLFKDLLDSAKGRYTEQTIQRCSQIVGPLGEALDAVFDSQVIENELYRHRRRNVDRDTNVHRMIDFLFEDSLFSNEAGRCHKAFPQYHHNENPKFPGKFQGKMKQLSKRLDKRRRITLDA